MQSISNNTARVIKAAVLGVTLGVKMWKSGWLVLVILILLVSGVSSLDVQAAQDTWSGVERIVTIGDVHGDYDRFVTLLRLPGWSTRTTIGSAGKLTSCKLAMFPTEAQTAAR